ncbi:hypothetical protein LR69_03193 [Geobacillus sp. BCO2]|nr:hypothetical protein LR69_03193 [Geobacillus sp. BCO2]
MFDDFSRIGNHCNVGMRALYRERFRKRTVRDDELIRFHGAGVEERFD